VTAVATVETTIEAAYAATVKVTVIATFEATAKATVVSALEATLVIMFKATVITVVAAVEANIQATVEHHEMKFKATAIYEAVQLRPQHGPKLKPQP
jgi:hypothetical protein